MGLQCEIFTMAVNLLPWRENKQQQSNKKILRYSFLYVAVAILGLIEVRHMLFNQLENIKKQTYLATAKFTSSKADTDKRTRTLWLISFLANLPIAMQDNLYVRKIIMRENLITLHVYADAVSRLEKFIMTIKQQGGINKITIDSAAMHGGIDYENEENKFLLTLFLG